MTFSTCKKCGRQISTKQFFYTKKYLGEPLCSAHQPILKNVGIDEKPKIVTSTPEAKRLASALLYRGWRVELNKNDGYKHTDIAITKAKVNIEVDGVQHNLSKEQALRDLKRAYHSFKKGFLTLRIPNSLVKDEETLQETADYIHKFLKESEDQLSN